MPASKRAAPKDKRMMRRARVSLMITGGASQREMADELKSSKSTINRDVVALRKEWVIMYQEANLQFTIDLRRLDEMLGAIYVAALRGHLPAVEVVLRILVRRAKMLGYDALEGALTDFVQEALDPTELTDDDLVNIIEGELKSKKLAAPKEK